MLVFERRLTFNRMEEYAAEAPASTTQEELGLATGSEQATRVDHSAEETVLESDAAVPGEGQLAVESPDNISAQSNFSACTDNAGWCSFLVFVCAKSFIYFARRIHACTAPHHYSIWTHSCINTFNFGQRA